MFLGDLQWNSSLSLTLLSLAQTKKGIAARHPAGSQERVGLGEREIRGQPTSISYFPASSHTSWVFPWLESNVRRPSFAWGCYCICSIKQTSHPPNLGCLFYHSIPWLTQIQRVSWVLWRFPLSLSAHNNALPFRNLTQNTRMSAGPSGTFRGRFSKASNMNANNAHNSKKKKYILYYCFRAPVMNFSGCRADNVRNERRPKKPQSPRLRSRMMFIDALFSFSIPKWE